MSKYQANSTIILGIESSCDDTAASVFCEDHLLSNCIAGQEIHREYGGIVPELASRAHQQNIIPVVDSAIKKAGVSKEQLCAIAFTRGPGLIGSLLVGTSFAKGLSLALAVPLIEINHMQAHVLAHFIRPATKQPSFPFLCLTVSGGHTQIVLVRDYLEMEVIGETMDDAAGEAFDKTAKTMGLPYPGGPLIDKLAREGNPFAFSFPATQMSGLNFSFSGIKTSFLYFIRDRMQTDPDFIFRHKADLAASVQKAILDQLMSKLILASQKTGISEIAVAGGVSSNSGLRKALTAEAGNRAWNIYLLKPDYCTDNAAMIAITGYYKFLKNKFSDQKVSASAKYPIPGGSDPAYL